MDEAPSIDPKLVSGLFVRAEQQAYRGKENEARVDLDAALAVEPDNPTVLRQKANLLYGLNRFVEALEYSEKVLALRPSDANAFSRHGAILANLERFSDARAAYREAVQLTQRPPSP